MNGIVITFLVVGAGLICLGFVSNGNLGAIDKRAVAGATEPAANYAGHSGKSTGRSQADIDNHTWQRAVALCASKVRGERVEPCAKTAYMNCAQTRDDGAECLRRNTNR